MVVVIVEIRNMAQWNGCIEGLRETKLQLELLCFVLYFLLENVIWKKPCETFF